MDAPILMSATLLPPISIKEVIFGCMCGWSGSEMELDVMTGINLVCCPICHNDDVRVVNDIEEKST